MNDFSVSAEKRRSSHIWFYVQTHPAPTLQTFPHIGPNPPQTRQQMPDRIPTPLLTTRGALRAPVLPLGHLPSTVDVPCPFALRGHEILAPQNKYIMEEGQW